MPKYKRIKRYATLAFTLFLILGLSGCGDRAPDKYQSTGIGMGTVINQTIYTTGEEDMISEVTSRIDQLEQNSLSWRMDTSEIARINASAGVEEGYQVSDDLMKYLKESFQVSEDSQGCFDLSIGPVVQLWKIDDYADTDYKGYVLPVKEAIEEALKAVDYSKITIKEDKIYLPKGMSLDLGSIGKGIACDEVRKLLDQKGTVSGAVISVGGSILVYGEKPDNSSWQIGITDPLSTGENAAVISLKETKCVSTSGDYERYVVVDGKKYHHIIDATTGYPGDNGVSSVTVLSDSGMLSDALSTTLFLLGPQKGLVIAEKYDAAVLFIMSDGTQIPSESMKPYLK